MNGTVYLVGAGPGDAGLMTVRGAQLLRKADVVVVDALVNPTLFKSLKAHVIDVGKRGPGALKGASHLLPQSEINQLLVRLAKKGKNVVRLKGGDPFVFGRGSEEIEALVDAGISFEVVPGVSSVHAVPAYAGIPITDRRWASQVTLLTGHEGMGSPGVDWKRLSPRGTLVILMGVSGWSKIRRRLLAAGWPRSKPVAAIEAGTTAAQRVILGTLDNSAAEFERRSLIAPATIVVGDVVRSARHLQWFAKGRLCGKQIAVTRPLDQSAALTSLLEREGAHVLSCPSIRIRPLSTTPPSGQFDWLLFLSVNAVKTFSALTQKRRAAYRTCRIMCVGEETRRVAESLGWKVPKVPSRFDSSGLLSAFGNVRGRSILAPRAQNAPKDLIHQLREKGARVIEVATYETIQATLPASIKRTLLAGVHAITFTSASTAQHFLSQFTGPEITKIFKTAAAVSMGRQTTGALKAGGVKNIREARNATLSHLIEVIPQ